MKEKEIIGMIGGGISPYTLLSSLMIAAAHKNSKFTAEEKAKREEKRRTLAEQRIRQAQIIKNICPDCEGKLARGKKDKKNAYKRIWICADCGSSHSM